MNTKQPFGILKLALISEWNNTMEQYIPPYTYIISHNKFPICQPVVGKDHLFYFFPLKKKKKDRNAFSKWDGEI